MLQIGDDEADVEPERRSFNATDGAPLTAPGFGRVAGLRVVAHNVLA
jgi:hypothetical protein